MDRDHLVEALTAFLDRISGPSGDLQGVLDSAGLDLARQLAAAAHSSDVHTAYLIATLHWRRYQALPEGEDQEDLEQALVLFGQLLPVDADLVPAPLRALVGDAIRADHILLDGDDPRTLSDAAVRLLQDPLAAADLTKLNRAITWLRQALATTPIDHPDRAGRLSHLGLALRMRFARTGAVADLDEAVQTGRAAVAATTTDHPDRAGRLSNLGTALLTRFGRTGAVADLDEAVQIGREAVAATPTEHPYRAGMLSNLGTALYSRFGHTGVLADLDEAVQTGRDAVATATTDDGYRAAMLSNLGGALATRFGRTGVVADLDEAVQVARAAVAATATDHPNRAATLSSLGGALATRFERTGAMADLDESVQISREAVAATPTDHPDQAMYLSNLGGTLRIRFERTGAVGDLDEAVLVGRAAVAAAPTDHPDRARYLSNLGLALQTRFGRAGAVADLDEAVQTGRAAVAATPTENPERALMLTNLGLALHTRFERTGATDDLDEAVLVGRAAVAAAATDDGNRAAMLSNLGLAVRTRSERTGAIADLDAAVRVSREAVAATPTNHPDRAIHLSNLGLALRTRFERTGATDDLDEAVLIGKAAVAATPTDHPNRATYLSNLGLALRTRFERSRVDSDRVAAMAAVREGAALITAPPAMRARCGRLSLNLAASAGQWRHAQRALRGVLGLLPQLVDPTLAIADRQHRLQALQGLGSDAARVALGAHPRRSWRRRRRAVKAWTVLEDGRGVLLRQALAARTDTTILRPIYDQLANELDHLRIQLAQPFTTPAAPTDPITGEPSAQAARLADDARTRRARDAYEQLEAVLARIRQQPGFSRFGLPPTIDELKSAATAGTIVALTVTDHGCGALILTHRKADYLPLPQLSAEYAVEQANRFLDALNPPPGHPVDAGPLLAVLGWLWDSTTGPILDHLGHTHTPKPNQPWPRVWWMPTGTLTVLPIHAAGHHSDPHTPRRRTVTDRVVSSYTPTAQLLAQARAHVRDRRSDTAPSNDPHRTLVVGIDHTPNLPELKFAEAEAQRVQHVLDPTAQPLLGSDATRDQVNARLADARVAHFACHALADHTDPSRSYLALHDAPLPVAELSQLQLPHAQLAFLSACTTATGSVRLLDESIHIASAFQLAGYPHVIATLWPINDYLAPDIATQVHAAIAAGAPPHLALHDTIRALRDQPAMRDRPQHWASHIHFGP